MERFNCRIKARLSSEFNLGIFMTKVLIAEDEALIAKVIETVLKKNGFEVARTNNGEEAVSLAHVFKPDVMIMDVRLKGSMSGAEAVRNIRGFSGVPVIFTTGNSKESVERSVLGLEPYRVLIKPVDMSELMKAIREAKA
jgi:two-component system KDP operon response regulator KdpE